MLNDEEILCLGIKIKCENWQNIIRKVVGAKRVKVGKMVLLFDK